MIRKNNEIIVRVRIPRIHQFFHLQENVYKISITCVLNLLYVCGFSIELPDLRISPNYTLKISYFISYSNNKNKNQATKQHLITH